MAEKINRYFFDTEFYDPQEESFKIEFISLGIVAENNKEFYGIYNGFDEDKCKKFAWLNEHVLSKLLPHSERLDLKTIKQSILDIIEPCDEIEFWAKNGTYDFFIMCRLFGGLGGLRDTLSEKKGITKVSFRDSNDLRRELDYPQTPELAEADKHDAIVDARHEKVEYDYMMNLKKAPKINPPKKSQEL